jgi:hypothetical protein
MYLAHIRYTEEEQELKPLTELGVEWVYRHGDTFMGYYKLDYSTVKKYGYATLEKNPTSEELVPNGLIHIYTLFCKE